MRVSVTKLSAIRLFFLFSFVGTLTSIVDSRIINASLAVSSPYYAKLTVYNADYTALHRGSGTFITRRHIVTSASFVSDATLVVVQFGSEFLVDLVETSFYPDIVIHPLYDPLTRAHDIAIIVLPVEIDHESVKPIEIMRDVMNPDNRVGDIVGFGWIPEDSHWIQNTRKVSFQSSWISPERCQELLGTRSILLQDSHFCALDIFNEASVCHGDEGAGYVMYTDTVWYLTGVLSVVTNMCNPQFPAMYTRVALYAEWIDEVVGGV